MTDILGWSPDDYAALVNVAADLGVPPDWIAAVMMSESSMRPWAKNPSGAQGLIQWANLGYDVTGWTPAEQMPLVGKYYKPWMPPGGYISRAQLYQANYLPATIAKKGSSPDTVISVKGDGNYQGTIFDATNKGYTTVGDLEVRLAKVTQGAQWAAAMAGIDQASPSSSPATNSMWTNALVLIAGGLAIGAAAHYLLPHDIGRQHRPARRRAA